MYYIKTCIHCSILVHYKDKTLYNVYQRRNACQSFSSLPISLGSFDINSNTIFSLKYTSSLSKLQIFLKYKVSYTKKYIYDMNESLCFLS